MREHYTHAARLLLEKCLSELLFEDALAPEIINSNEQVHNEDFCQLRLSLASGNTYRAQAQRSIWGQWLISPNCVTRNGHPAHCPLQLLLDAQTELALTDIVLANLLEEIGNTLLADQHLLARRQDYRAEDLAQLPFDELQAFLDGHPKAIANKGRMGWGLDEHRRYAPEHQPKIQLHWVAQLKQHTNFSGLESEESEALLASVLSKQELAQVKKTLPGELADWCVLPVHPWQWTHKIQTHYAAQLARNELIYLGQMGAYFRPQQSLRTLANIDNPSAPDIKLPITILNTSCYRGIPGKTICAGTEISRWLKNICAEDAELDNTVVLEEIAGAHINHPLWGSIAEPPYRFNETLGAIWRLPVGRFLGANQQAVMLGALWQTDNSGEPLLATWLKQSGLSLTQWLHDLFQHMVVPLYHLLAAYGIGLIAHGQNITLILTQGRITGMAIKDFQGDLRLDDRLRKCHNYLSSEGYRAIDKLPAHYLIHDLQTGNFLTALRFISAMCWQQLALPEIQFYRLLAQAIRDYQGRHPELVAHYRRFDLFTPSVAKLCINRVRFASGYDDSASRPKPIRGRDINNPLYLADSMHHSDTPLETSCTTI